MSALSETETIRLAQSGDEDAFALLYQRNLDAVYRYILKRVGEVYEAENITQTVFTKAWLAIERYKPTAVPFRAWLYRIAHNAVIDHYRTQKEIVHWDDLSMVPDASRPLEEVVLSQERSAQVRQAMTNIKPSYQAVLSHRFLNNLDYAETAQELGHKVETVRVLQHRALNALQKVINQQAGAWIALLVAFVSLGLGLQTVRATAGALPGDRLYGVKIALEDARLTLFEAAGDTRHYADYTDRRLAEIATLLDAGRLDDVERATTQLTAHLERMSTTLATLAQTDAALAQQVADPLLASLQTQHETLDALVSREPEQLQSLFQPVIDAVETVQSTIEDSASNPVDGEGIESMPPAEIDEPILLPTATPVAIEPDETNGVKVADVSNDALSTEVTVKPTPVLVPTEVPNELIAANAAAVQAPIAIEPSDQADLSLQNDQPLAVDQEPTVIVRQGQQPEGEGIALLDVQPVIREAEENAKQGNEANSEPTESPAANVSVQPTSAVTVDTQPRRDEGQEQNQTPTEELATASDGNGNSRQSQNEERTEERIEPVNRQPNEQRDGTNNEPRTRPQNEPNQDTNNEQRNNAQDNNAQADSQERTNRDERKEPGQDQQEQSARDDNNRSNGSGRAERENKEDKSGDSRKR